MDFLAGLMNPVFIIAIVLVILILGGIILFVRNYIKVPTDQVAVFTGRGEPKVVRGGGRLRIPGLERVDYMSLQPISVNISTTGAISKDGVPVTVDAVGWVRIGSEDSSVRTAMERFPNMDPNTLSRDLNNILAGSLRGIVAKMTVEDLNGNREALAQSIMDEAGSALEKVGLSIDNLTIQDISDQVGYLKALGRKRTAEVLRDAEIGEAEATRDSRIRSAAAKQQGEIAQAQADTEIANARKAYDLQVASNKAETDAAQAKASQAGPLADATARKDVLVADEQANAAQVEARTRVEELRAAQQEQKLVADTIKPAEAEARASVLRAEGEREAAVKTAEGQAAATRATGAAQADSRKALAAADQAERVARAEGEKAGLLATAEGKKADLLATAEGERQLLLARAEGQAKLADALNTFSEAAAQLQMLPEILRAMVDQTAAAAKPVGEIDKITVISSGNGDVTGGIQNIVPETLMKTVAMLESQGIDVASMVAGFGKKQPQVVAPQVPSSDDEA